MAATRYQTNLVLPSAFCSVLLPCLWHFYDAIYHDKLLMTEEIEPHILRKFEIIQKLGKGAYGIVWKAIDKKMK